MQADEMRVAAEFAGLAPSVHNTQPWRFVAGPHALELHLVPDRTLSFLDPRGRQTYLSCGIAVEFARLAIRSLGSACTVRLLPDPDQETLLAKVVVGSADPATPDEQRMIDAVARRYTDRGPYSDEAVTPAELQRMQEAASERNCWIRVLNHPDDRVTAIRLLESAEDAEATEPLYREELQRWRRYGLSHDGVPADRHAEWVLQRRVSDVPLRDFAGNGHHPRPGAEEPPTVERDALVLLGTDRDDPLSWLQAGRALGDVLLVLTDAELVSQPLGPVLDLPGTRAQLRRDLGLVGYPQMLLRVGHGVRRPITGRLPIEQMFSVAATP